MDTPDPHREEIGALADYLWGVDRGWALDTFDEAARRVGVSVARDYMRARLTRISQHDPSLADLHRSVFPDHPLPLAWSVADQERDYKAALRVEAGRQKDHREAVRERARRRRAAGKD